LSGRGRVNPLSPSVFIRRGPWRGRGGPLGWPRRRGAFGVITSTTAIGGPAPRATPASSTFPRRSAKATTATAAASTATTSSTTASATGATAAIGATGPKAKVTGAAPVPAAPQKAPAGADTAIGIRDARAPAPGIGTGKQGAKEEPAADPTAAATPDPTMKRLVPVPSPSRAAAARGVMAYAQQAAAKAVAKQAVALPAALIDVA